MAVAKLRSVSGNVLPGVCWQGSTGTNDVRLFDIETGELLRIISNLPFAPRNITILGNGNVVSSAGDPTMKAVRTSMIVFDPRGNILREYDLNRVGWLKTGCPVIGTTQELISASQDSNMIHRIDVSGRKEILVWSATTGDTPRGLVMDRDGDIWVCCKRGNTGVLQGNLSQIVLHDGDDGSYKLGIPIPFGARGVAVDSNNEAWCSCLGDQNFAIGGGIPNGVFVCHVNKDGLLRHMIKVGDGPFGITIDTEDNKYVACGSSDQVFKIDPDGVVVDDGNWPFSTLSLGSDHTGPVSVALDGNQKLWVQYKSSPFLTRLAREDATVELDIDTGTTGAPETLGDFVGHQRAMILSPLLDHDGDDKPNLAELTAGTNPFDRFD